MNAYLRGLLMAVIPALAIAACSGSVPKPIAAQIRPQNLPTFHYLCRPHALAMSAKMTVPIRVVRSPGGGAVAVTGVCIHGRGPYTFLVDSGSASSVIDAALADRLNLTTVGKLTGSSFGCRRSLSTAYLDDWTLGARNLAGQWVAVGGVASRAFPNLMGILGADILSRFGVVRLDYAAQTMTMETEGPPPTSSVRGSTATMSVPASFSRGTVQVVPMDVDVVHDELLVFLKLSAVRPDVQVSVGGQHREFVLDTGASLTVLSPMLTRSARLGPPIRTALFNAGLSCPVSASIYQLTSWSLGTLRLHPASVVSNQLPPGVDGLLGSGTLELYSPVVLDFLDGAILLSRLHAS